MEGSGSFFSSLIEALGSSVETQVISYPHDQALNYAQLTQFVGKSLPKDAHYVLLGESFSGPIAVAIAAEKPTGLQAIILACSFVHSPIPIPKAFRSIVSLIPASWIPAKIVSKYLLGSYATTEIEARLGKVLSKIIADVWQERLLSVLNVDLKKELSEIAVPILSIRATQDQIVPKSAAKFITHCQPNTVTAEIEGPHFILQARPTTSASCILRFLTDARILL